MITDPGAVLAFVLIAIGLVGAVVPVIPGPPLVWLGIFVWALNTRFERVEGITLAVLGAIALVATFSEYWLQPISQRRAGLGWKNILAAFGGGIVGGIGLTFIPVAGTLFGAVIGSLLGTMAVTYLEKRNGRAALHAARVYLLGCALSALIEVTLSLVMLGIFAWRAFL
jgi:uncharacterized protein YqgC (DUF456 family)